jgi:hypothetical protein
MRPKTRVSFLYYLSDNHLQLCRVKVYAFPISAITNPKWKHPDDFQNPKTQPPKTEAFTLAPPPPRPDQLLYTTEQN